MYDTLQLGESYTFKGEEFTPEETGTIALYDTLANMHGCDSIVTLTLTTIAPEPQECDTIYTTWEDSVYEGDSLLFGCRMVADAATYVDTLYSATDEGCVVTIDSLILTVLPYDSVRAYAYDTVYAYLCAGSEYTLLNNQIIIVENDTAVNDTLPDYLPMYEDKDKHLHIYTDSVVTYYLSVWAQRDTTLYETLQLGESYTFKGEEFTPEETGTIVLYDTLANMHGCDSIVTLELTVKAQPEPKPYETVNDTVQSYSYDTVCLNTEYMYCERTYTITRDTLLSSVAEIDRDTLEADRVVEVHYRDSLHAISVWHDTLDVVLPEWEYAFCGVPFTGADTIIEALRAAVEADELYQQDVTYSIEYATSEGAYQPYDGAPLSSELDEVKMRVLLSNACQTLTFAQTLAVQKPDYQLSEQFDAMPAVSKYNDWLLMVDLDSLNKVYNLYPDADSVRWYRIRGTKADIDNDELIGTGYYYTDDRHLTGSYYAVIGLPEQSDECGGTWRTRVLVQTNGSGPLLLAPTLAKAGQPLWLYHLLPDEKSTLRIYDSQGSCVRMKTEAETAEQTDGATRISTEGLPAGVYMLQVTNSRQQQALTFIIKE